MKNTINLFFLLILSLLLVSCGGASTNFSSTTGKSSVVASVRNTAPIENCPNGGITVDTGIDTNGNGILDPAEATSTQYVCNGRAGADGLASLVLISYEPAGDNCTDGGSKVDAGKDANSNNILDASEISTTKYICNGSSGSNGHSSLLTITTEPAGANCTYSGKKMQSGLDSNANGILDAGEVTTTTYVCNGAGVNWVSVTGTAVQAVPNTGYLANNTAQVAITLPAAPAVGDLIQVSGIGTGGWKIAQNAGQSIITGNLPGNAGVTWTARDSARDWRRVASSADGSKLVAAANSGYLYTSTDSGLTWTARATDASRFWYGVASSDDGSKLVATERNGYIYTSIDSGINWTARATDAGRNWFDVASSTDGSKLVATDYQGFIYTSVNSGEIWVARATDAYRGWFVAASSADGSKLIAGVYGGQLYTSTDSGANWVARPIDIANTTKSWRGVASSADGSKLVATADGGYIYTSTDSGLTWTARADDANRPWQGVTSSTDGRKLVATTDGNGLYTSTDSGLTWTARNLTGHWWGVASSADGSKLVATTYDIGQLHTSVPTVIPSTTTGITGVVSGSQYDAVDLQCIDTYLFVVRSHEGYLTIQ